MSFFFGLFGQRKVIAKDGDLQHTMRRFSCWAAGHFSAVLLELLAGVTIGGAALSSTVITKTAKGGLSRSLFYYHYHLVGGIRPLAYILNRHGDVFRQPHMEGGKQGNVPHHTCPCCSHIITTYEAAIWCTHRNNALGWVYLTQK